MEGFGLNSFLYSLLCLSENILCCFSEAFFMKKLPFIDFFF
ncbi:hypothetical protein KIS1582_4433 [Cytobacillus firmus]|uniref:Uncharacterized protein n=1 Tax=Cytobacillus firmus TaxID=1399 RepID=A0A800MSX6_CYTFI|nr:hypothetical protein KIS1582_4433 [Cytobacillus firmus]